MQRHVCGGAVLPRGEINQIFLEGNARWGSFSKESGPKTPARRKLRTKNPFGNFLLGKQTDFIFSKNSMTLGFEFLKFATFRSDCSDITENEIEIRFWIARHFLKTENRPERGCKEPPWRARHKLQPHERERRIIDSSAQVRRHACATPAGRGRFFLPSGRADRGAARTSQLSDAICRHFFSTWDWNCGIGLALLGSTGHLTYA